MNFRFMLVFSGILAVASGLLNPFLIVLLNGAGSFRDFGFLIGISMVVASVASYFTGSFSDKVGRKPVLIASLVGYAFVTIAYTFSKDIFYLAFLQSIVGVLQAMFTTANNALLADITDDDSRGKKIGTEASLSSLIGGLTVMAGGVIASIVGINTVFYMVSFLFIASILPLMKINENRKSRT
ncbi:MAG: MFS transporter [Candidatus Aenigmarchaeota archaeon]|nr:MFS transporter [Candidatus Aenigmarchaeota archaeon]